MLNGKSGLITKLVMVVGSAVIGVVSTIVNHRDANRTDEQIKQLKELSESLSKIDK